MTVSLILSYLINTDVHILNFTALVAKISPYYPKYISVNTEKKQHVLTVSGSK